MNEKDFSKDIEDRIEEEKKEILDEVHKEIEEVSKQKKPLFQIKTLKGMLASVTSIIGVITTIIAFAVQFQTSHLTAKIEKMKIDYEIETKKKFETYQARISALNDLQTKHKEFIGEIVFLRYNIGYVNAVNKYMQRETQTNANVLKKSIEDFATYVYQKQHDLIKSEKNVDLIHYAQLSCTYLKFNGNTYPIPQDVLMKVEEIKRRKK